MNTREENQKITAHIPASLLKKAQNYTHEGITETIKQGLEQIVRAGAYKNIAAFKGKVNLSIDIDKLRDDN